MRSLVAAEFTKLITTRAWLWLLLVAVALTALYTSLTIGFSDVDGTWTFPLDTAAGQRTLFAVGAAPAGALAGVLGALTLTGEFKHRTITTTFLSSPRRSPVVVAKLVTATLVGAGYGLACLLTTAVIAVPWTHREGIALSPATNGIPATMAGVIVGAALFAAAGVGLGALLRDQTATVVGMLTYLFVAEPIVVRVPALESWTMFLPGPAQNALTQVALTNQDFLLPWQGGLMLAAYAAAWSAVGIVAIARRDVT